MLLHHNSLHALLSRKIVILSKLRQNCTSHNQYSWLKGPWRTPKVVTSWQNKLPSNMDK